MGHASTAGYLLALVAMGTALQASAQAPADVGRAADGVSALELVQNNPGTSGRTRAGRRQGRPLNTIGDDALLRPNPAGDGVAASSERTRGAGYSTGGSGGEDALIPSQSLGTGGGEERPMESFTPPLQRATGRLSGKRQALPPGTPKSGQVGNPPSSPGTGSANGGKKRAKGGGGKGTAGVPSTAKGSQTPKQAAKRATGDAPKMRRRSGQRGQPGPGAEKARAKKRARKRNK